MYQKTEGIVLREVAYRDSDKILTVLTRGLGKITLKARGVRSKSSRLKSACQLLAYSEFTFLDRMGYLTITEATALEMFPELRADLELLSLASYFAQVSEILSQEDAPNDALLSLLLNSLYALGKLKKEQRLVKPVFELAAAALGGYAPMLDGCAICGAKEPGLFNVRHGVLQCADCSSQEMDGLRLPVGPGTLDALRYILQADRKRLFSFQVGPDTLQELGQLAETYLMTQLERGFPTLDFYKTVQLDSN